MVGTSNQSVPEMAIDQWPLSRYSETWPELLQTRPPKVTAPGLVIPGRT